MSNKIRAIVVDVETGEELYNIYDGEYPFCNPDDKKEQLIKYNSGKSFVKLFEGTSKLIKFLSNAEFTTMIALADFVCYNDCILRNHGIRNGKILDINSMSELLGIPYSTLTRNINSLIEKGVIAEVKTGTINPDETNKSTKCYLANPDIYLRGTCINTTVQAIFEKTGWKEYRDKYMLDKDFLELQRESSEKTA